MDDCWDAGTGVYLASPCQNDQATLLLFLLRLFLLLCLLLRLLRLLLRLLLPPPDRLFQVLRAELASSDAWQVLWRRRKSLPRNAA